MSKDIVLDTQIKLFKKRLSQDGRLEIKVKGYSMWPFLNNSSEVMIAQAGLKDIFPGDIVFTHTDEQFFCHRLFRKKDKSFQTKADALIGPDSWLGQDKLIGKVVAYRRGKVLKPANTPWFRFSGLVTLWFTFFSCPFYPALRVIKRLFLRSTKKQHA